MACFTEENKTYHVPVNSLLLQQLHMTALLQKLALTKHKNDICILHRRQPMSNHNHGAPLAGALKRRLHELLALRVERACGLVQEQDVWLADQGTGNGNALLLAS